MTKRRPAPEPVDTLARDLKNLKQAYRNSWIQRPMRDCKPHDFTVSDTCRKCGYEVPFMPVIEPLSDAEEHLIVDVYDTPDGGRS